MNPLRVLPVVLTAGVVAATPLVAQGYRLQLESRVQSASYRGVRLDSVPSGSVVTAANGGLVSPDGFAVSCVAGAAFCTFFRPGAERTGGPLVTTADVSLWDLGVSGLSIRGRSRVGVDVGDSDVWPGTEPAVQLLEGFLEYVQRRFTVQAGRLTERSRFGYTGFDGGRGTIRASGGRFWATAFGGWGLGRGTVLPLTSPALNPLDEFRPEQRQLVFGGAAGWTTSFASGSMRYERQVDPDADGLVSERLGSDVVLRLARGISLAAGADYDLASGWLGSAEGVLGISPARVPVTVSLGGRRYRPHFELWTIWGAFSPVPYHAGFASVTATPVTRLQVRARGEVFQYDDPEATSPLTSAEDGGWRISLGGRYTYRRLTGDVEYHLDKNVGARSLGVDASVTWRPTSDLSLSGRVSNLKRALEFRFSDTEVWMFGGSADWRLASHIRAFAAAAFFDESRDRDDAAAFSWSQVRLSAGLRVLLTSGADRIGLPPAILRIPEGGAR